MAYLLELVEVTALQKDGPSLCKQFAEMIDPVEIHYGCIVIYFITDADGGGKKGASCWFQLILGDYFKVNDMAVLITEEATALIGWINNHGKVRKIFDESQAAISTDPEVGKAELTKQQHLEEEAISFCDKIEDTSFWNGLEMVLGDLELICLGTNINQKDSTRPDQIEQMYCLMKSGPDNSDSPARCKEKDQELQSMFLQYLSHTGEFADFNTEEWEDIYIQKEMLSKKPANDFYFSVRPSMTEDMLFITHAT
ncbi:hypothetical protein B0H10DRAFT_1949468 [Mycena sp. CBHHK59/15]|nr:hypothetical protein B0H10DRAFT_1949468 [Mycena sp. CBHHK59/15]